MCNYDAIPSWLRTPTGDVPLQSTNRLNFLRRTIHDLANIFSNEIYLSQEAKKAGFLQQIDPRFKLLVFLGFILISNFAHSFVLLGVLFFIGLLYARLSKISLAVLLKRSWLIIPLFILICSLPALFNVFVAGHPLVVFLPPNAERSFFKHGLYLSDNGVKVVLLMFVRSGVTLSFAYLLMITTCWHDLTKGMAQMKLPVSFILILDMTYRYIFLLSNLALQMSEARFLRSVGSLSHRENRRFLGHSIALLFIKASYLAHEIFSAMRIRGYTHKVVSLKTLKLTLIDWIFLINNGLIMLVLLMVVKR